MLLIFLSGYSIVRHCAHTVREPAVVPKMKRWKFIAISNTLQALNLLVFLFLIFFLLLSQFIGDSVWYKTQFWSSFVVAFLPYLCVSLCRINENVCIHAESHNHFFSIHITHFCLLFFGDFERFDTRDKHVELHILHAIDQKWQQQNKRTRKGLHTGESGKKTNNSDEKTNSFSQ